MNSSPVPEMGLLIVALLVGAAACAPAPARPNTPTRILPLAVAAPVRPESRRNTDIRNIDARATFEAARWEPMKGAVAGTYSIAVCRQRCTVGDEARAYVVGELVLFEDATGALNQGAVPPLRRAVALSSQEETIGGENRLPRGCVQLRSNLALGDSYLGIESHDWFRWEPYSTGTLVFPLYTSPDAGYEVEAVVRQGTLVGVGASRGGRDASWEGPEDYIVGRRIGPPNPAICATANPDPS